MLSNSFVGVLSSSVDDQIIDVHRSLRRGVNQRLFSMCLILLFLFPDLSSAQMRSCKSRCLFVC